MKGISWDGCTCTQRERTVEVHPERQRVMTETKVKSSVQVTEKDRVLNPVEEKVVRMIHGLGAPGHHELEQLTDVYPEAAAEIAAIQARVLEACAPRDNSKKRGIIAKLRKR